MSGSGPHSSVIGVLECVDLIQSTRRAMGHEGPPFRIQTRQPIEAPAAVALLVIANRGESSRAERSMASTARGHRTECDWHDLNSRRPIAAIAVRVRRGHRNGKLMEEKEK